MTASRNIRVATRDDAVDLVRAARAARAAVALEGAGSKRGWGNPVDAPWSASLADFRGIVRYEPEELVLTVRPGTPLVEIDTLLAERRQMLAFEPPDYGPLWGAGAACATIGGTVACNASGPRRLRAGAARDYLLGAEFVNGRGELVRTGGRVVKNVTGYDLCKLLAGSFGTLGIFTELTLKTAPRPACGASLALRELDPAAATRVIATLMADAEAPSSVAYLPRAIAPEFDGGGSDDALLVARFEGSADGIAERVGGMLHAHGGVVLDDAASRALWLRIRDVEPLSGAGALWRIAIAPASLGAVAAALERAQISRWLADWGGSLVWVSLHDDDGTRDVRAIATAVSGRATLFRAPSQRSAAVWPALAPAVAALNARIKASFDPDAVLNPGRLGA